MLFRKVTKKVSLKYGRIRNKAEEANGEYQSADLILNTEGKQC